MLQKELKLDQNKFGSKTLGGTKELFRPGFSKT